MAFQPDRGSPRVVAITGASRGIGAALAEHYAAPDRLLLLLGRDAAALAEVAASCRRKGAKVKLQAVDVCDRDGLARYLLEVDQRSPIDLLLANAGILIGTDEANATDRLEDAARLIEINLVGALNTILPVLQRMQQRRHGQIGIMSSLAAIAPMVNAPAYSASKAALLAYGLALRETARLHGVRVNVICPGYVETAMSARQRGWMPLRLPAADAAVRIARGLARDRDVIAFPLVMAVLAKLAALTPERLRRIGQKPFRLMIGP